MLIYRVLQGAFTAFFGPIQYSILADFFPKHLRVKSYSIYMILFQMGEVLNNFTLILVDIVGWRWSVGICGLQGAIAGILGLIFVVEPSRVDDDEEEPV